MLRLRMLWLVTKGPKFVPVVTRPRLLRPKIDSSERVPSDALLRRRNMRRQKSPIGVSPCHQAGITSGYALPYGQAGIAYGYTLSCH